MNGVLCVFFPSTHFLSIFNEGFSFSNLQITELSNYQIILPLPHQFFKKCLYYIVIR